MLILITRSLTVDEKNASTENEQMAIPMAGYIHYTSNLEKLMHCTSRNTTLVNNTENLD